MRQIANGNGKITYQNINSPEKYSVVVLQCHMGLNQVRVSATVNMKNPRPNSNNPKFIENWTMDLPKDFPNYEKIAEAWEKGEKYNPANNV